MVSKLTKAMGALTHESDETMAQERRKSARLLHQREEQHHHHHRIPHDSGTESDDEEVESINQSICSDPMGPLSSFTEYDFNPQNFSSTPPVKRDVDTESWDSFGRESGIMTGDNDSEDGAATPTPNRRRIKDDESPGEKRKHESSEMNDHPIAWRLRSFNTVVPQELNRPVKIAARKVPIHVITNRPPINAVYRFDHAEHEVESAELNPAPAPAKRNRRNSHRPSCDFEKMVQTRIEETPSSPNSIGFKKPVTRSQIITQQQ